MSLLASSSVVVLWPCKTRIKEESVMAFSLLLAATVSSPSNVVVLATRRNCRTLTFLSFALDELLIFDLDFILFTFSFSKRIINFSHFLNFKIPKFIWIFPRKIRVKNDFTNFPNSCSKVDYSLVLALQLTPFSKFSHFVSR